MDASWKKLFAIVCLILPYTIWMGMEWKAEREISAQNTLVSLSGISFSQSCHQECKEESVDVVMGDDGRFYKNPCEAKCAEVGFTRDMKGVLEKSDTEVQTLAMEQVRHINEYLRILQSDEEVTLEAINIAKQEFIKLFDNPEARIKVVFHPGNKHIFVPVVDYLDRITHRNQIDIEVTAVTVGITGIPEFHDDGTLRIPYGKLKKIEFDPSGEPQLSDLSFALTIFPEKFSYEPSGQRHAIYPGEQVITDLTLTEALSQSQFLGISEK